MTFSLKRLWLITGCSEREVYIIFHSRRRSRFVLPVIKIWRMALLIAQVVGMRSWIRRRTESRISLPTNRSVFALVKKADSVCIEVGCDWSHRLDKIKVLRLGFTIWKRTCNEETNLILWTGINWFKIGFSVLRKFISWHWAHFQGPSLRH
jgi:hypothetical protein